MQQTSTITPAAEKEVVQVFGLRYLEEEEADILEVAGCQGVIADATSSMMAITYRLCGDGWDSSTTTTTTPR